MYLRTTARRNKDGTLVRYLALAHNRRIDGATQAQVLLNLGREDRLDPAGLRRLVGWSTATSASPTPPRAPTPPRPSAATTTPLGCG
jgi:hypothetical protein